MSKTEKNGKPTMEDLIRLDLMSSVSLIQIVLDNKEVFDAVVVVIKKWQQKRKEAEEVQLNNV